MTSLHITALRGNLDDESAKKTALEAYKLPVYANLTAVGRFIKT